MVDFCEVKIDVTGVSFHVGRGDIFMDKKICFAVVCALAVVYGCDDDAGLGSKVVETCTRPGETKCTTEGARVVCQDGVYVPSACESNEACVAGECVRRCDVATFPKDCDGNVSVTCGPDGYVVRKPCDGTCVGGDCRSSQSGGNVGDDCDASTFEGRCDGLLDQIVCRDGVETREPCDSDMVCTGKQCSRACTGDLAVCNAGGDRLLCIDNVIVPTPCPESEVCVDGACGTTCKADFKSCSVDGKSKLFCGSNGLVKSENCPTGFTCNVESGECTDVAVDADCTPETVPDQCDADGQVVKCVDGKIEKRACKSPDLTCYLGKCEKLAPCGESTYTPKCIDGGARKICKGNAEYIEKCATGAVCDGGVCQTISTVEECKDGSVACVSENIAKKCENKVWKQYYCTVENKVCNSGVCKDKSTDLEACVEAEFAPKCDGNTRKVCEFGYISSYTCEAGQHCKDGICYDDVNIGDPCDDKFTNQCDDEGRLIVCNQGTVEAHSCGDRVCVAGACVDCNSTNYTATCADVRSPLVCKEGKIVKDSCAADKHCENGACVDSPKAGESCDSNAFSDYCSADGKLLKCDGAVVVERVCEGATPYCLNNSCVACNPADGARCVAGTGGGVASIVACDAKGTKTETNCAQGQTTCFGNACAQCDPNQYTKACDGEKKARSCNDKGEIVETNCNTDAICENGECRKACQSDTDCGPNHKCNEAKKCEFVPECTDIGRIECHAEDGKPTIVRKCEGKGLWKTIATCKTGDVCGADDADSTKLVCRGTNCTEPGLLYCTDNTPTKCVNGRYEKVGTVCTGEKPKCVDGSCRVCQYGETKGTCGVGETTGTTKYTYCKEDNTYGSDICNNTQNCDINKGCVSKCGAEFKETCKDEGTVSRTRIVCNEKGEKVEQQCAHTEICTDGQCVDRRTTEKCNAYTYDKNECIEDGKGNVYLEYCGKDGFTYEKCNDDHPGDANQGQFCGKVGDFTDVGCWKKCSSINVTYCSVQSLTAGTMGTVGICQNGVDYKGNAKTGIHTSAGLCDERGASSSCFVNANSKLIWNYFSCSHLNDGGVCNAQTGSCKDFAVASCSTPSASCNGNKAVRCALDPASISDTNHDGYVRIEEDCSKIAQGAECVTYTLHGMPMARCASEQDLQFGGEPKTKESTLGRCDNSGAKPTVKQLHKTNNNGWLRIENECSGIGGSTCKTGETDLSTSNKKYTFAYCD